MGAGLAVGIWLARYLGPEQYGLLNYAMAFVALFSAVATLGLNDIVVRDLISDPENSHTTLGTAFVLQMAGALTAMGLSFAVIVWLRPQDGLIKAMIVILAGVMIFKSSEVIKYWFESRVQSRYVIWVENGFFLLAASIKVALILSHAPLIAFVWTVLLEAIFVASGFFVIYVSQTNALTHWKVSLSRAKSLMRASWPLALSGIAIMVYMRIDQIMLGEMLGDEAVGVYSAALRVSEVWYMIPTIITASVFPAIIESKKKSEVIYQTRVQGLLNLMASIALVIALVVSFCSNWMIELLFGGYYADAAPVLMVHIWAGLFVFLGGAGNKWYLAEDIQHLILYRTVAGAIVNVFINLALIPSYGALGAAIATVVSYAISAYFLDAFSKKTRVMFVYKTLAILAGPYRLAFWR